MPLVGILLSLLGLAPFVVFGLGALGSDPVRAGHMLAMLIDYASVVLAFVGGVHWGLILREPEPFPVSQPVRIALAVVPMLIGWLALALSLLTAAWLVLLLLIAGYVATVAAEHRGGYLSGLPARYLWLRWLFTLVAVAMMTTVMTLRLLGQTIVFS